MRHLLPVSIIFAFFLNTMALVAHAQSTLPVPTQRPSNSNTLPVETKKLNPGANEEARTMAFDTCLGDLAKLGVEFVKMEPFKNEDGCGISDPVKIMSVPARNSDITLGAQPQLSCKFALKFSIWLSDVGAPITENLTRSPLFSVATGPGFVCRHRNNDGSRKISEHAVGNAIDINSFGFANGEKLSVAAVIGGSAEEKRTLSALRIASCGFFTTVLGPGTNEAHSSHFHLDHGKHGRTWNYRICE